MALSMQSSLLAFVFLQAILLPSPVNCNKGEDDLLQGINSYRQTISVPALYENKKAGCLADKIADKLEDEPCANNPGPITSTTLTSSRSQIIGINYEDLVRKCKIDVNSTRDGVILPVCVPKLVPTMVLANYTHSNQYRRFLNDSNYTGAGLGSEDDWMVVILVTDTPTGSFASSAAAAARGGLVPVVGFSATTRCLVLLLLGIVFVVL